MKCEVCGEPIGPGKRVLGGRFVQRCKNGHERYYAIRCPKCGSDEPDVSGSSQSEQYRCPRCDNRWEWVVDNEFVTRAFSLTEYYRAMIKAHGAAIGKNDSAALRDILDKAAEAGITGKEQDA